MKTTLQITTLAVFTFIGTISFGQSLNISGGYTTSGFMSKNMEEAEYTESYGDGIYTSSYKYKNVGGYNASIGYEFRLGNRLSLETGFKYQTRGFQEVSERGYQSATESSTSSDVTKYKFNYLDVPVVLNTAITTGDFRSYIRTGIYAGFMTGGKYSEHSEYSSSNGEKGEYTYSEKMVNEFPADRFTGGFIVGAGAEYKGFYFETNLNLGAFSLANFDSELYTRDLSFSLGYKIKFTK